MFKPKFKYTFDGAVKTSQTQALFWRNTGPLARRCVVSLSLLRIVKKMRSLLPKIEGFGGIPGPEAYQIKNEYAQRRRLRRNKFTSKSEVSRLQRFYQTPKKWKLAFQKYKL